MNLATNTTLEVDRPVSVYGGGAWKPGSEGWALAEIIGKSIVEKGFTVVTGGYGGAMAAASKGAREAGGMPVGILYAPPEKQMPNRYIQVSYVAADYMDRMAILLRVPYAVALPGGSGTIAEIMASVALLRRFDGRRLALWKPFWHSRLDPMLIELGPTSLGQVDWVSSAQDVTSWLKSLR